MENAKEIEALVEIVELLLSVTDNNCLDNETFQSTLRKEIIETLAEIKSHDLEGKEKYLGEAVPLLLSKYEEEINEILQKSDNGI